jgi:hypothetical protein
MEFEPTAPVFDLVKAVHDLDRAATVIGSVRVYSGIVPQSM